MTFERPVYPVQIRLYSPRASLSIERPKKVGTHIILQFHEWWQGQTTNSDIRGVKSRGGK